MPYAHWHNGLAIEILAEQFYTTIEQTCFEINICRQFAFCEQLGLSGLCTALHSMYTCLHSQYLIPHSHCYVLCLTHKWLEWTWGQLVGWMQLTNKVSMLTLTPAMRWWRICSIWPSQHASHSSTSCNRK